MGSHSIHPETRKALASTATPFGLLRPAELVPRQVIVKSAVNAVLGLLVFVCAYSEIFFKHQTTPAVWWAAVVLPLSCALCYLYLLVAFSRNELRQFPSHQHPVLLVLSVVALLAAHYLVREKRENSARDRVANFHLNNGASIARINFPADLSRRGQKQSAGMVVNYRYTLANTYPALLLVPSK